MLAQKKENAMAVLFCVCMGGVNERANELSHDSLHLLHCSARQVNESMVTASVHTLLLLLHGHHHPFSAIILA